MLIKKNYNLIQLFAVEVPEVCEVVKTVEELAAAALLYDFF